MNPAMEERVGRQAQNQDIRAQERFEGTSVYVPYFTDSAVQRDDALHCSLFGQQGWGPHLGFWILPLGHSPNP